MTGELGSVGGVQGAVDELNRTRGIIVPQVFYRMVADRRRGKKVLRKITALNRTCATAWDVSRVWWKKKNGVTSC
jgi:hypothetical protein